MTTKPNRSLQTAARTRRRYVVLGLGIIAMVAAIYYGPSLREQEPDYYNPARTALVNARMRLEESLGHEHALIAQLQMAREELDSAIANLARAADLDPADRARIDALRSSIQSIESPDQPGEASPEKLHQAYGELLAEMEALISDLDKRTP
jgi:predicted TPR repeat methyltransferase